MEQLYRAAARQQWELPQQYPMVLEPEYRPRQWRLEYPQLVRPVVDSRLLLRAT
jgi:hypothetical protein